MGGGCLCPRVVRCAPQRTYLPTLDVVVVLLIVGFKISAMHPEVTVSVVCSLKQIIRSLESETVFVTLFSKCVL